MLRNQGESTNYNILGEAMNYFCQLELKLDIYDLKEVTDVSLDYTNIQLSRQVLSTLTEIVSGPNEDNQVNFVLTFFLLIFFFFQDKFNWNKSIVSTIE